MSLSIDHSVPRNRLLAMLPTEAYQKLLPNLELVDLGLKQLLYEENTPIAYVYFPYNGVASLLTVMEDGTLAEVGTVGSEGMVGIPVILGASQTLGRAFSQIPGQAMRMKADVCKREIDKNQAFTRALHRYLQVMFVQLAQRTVCNCHHSPEQRCARWMLQTQDRVESDTFPVTQEFLSDMLGVRRASVNDVALLLQDKGMIRYQRGVVAILNKAALEVISCDCYGLIKAEYDRMLNHPIEPNSI